MSAFTDPRDPIVPGGVKSPPRTTTEPNDLSELHQLCREARLYDIERWIRDGRPLQVAQGTPVKRARATSALEIATQAGNHALVLLLLCNGYDPNQELQCPLDIALRARRFDLVNLLLEWGADPHSVDLADLFDTYNSELFRRFQELGVELTKGHALAEALADHTSNRPLFGFAKRQSESNSKIKTELNIALAHHVEKENERGIQLCLWAGADPHARAPSFDYSRGSADGENEDDDADSGVSAVYEACLRGNAAILKRLRPDPARDDFDKLFQAASSGAVIDLLAKQARPKRIAAVIEHQLWWATFDRGQWRSIETIERLFKVGVRWTQSSAEEIATIRRSLLNAPDHTFVDLVKLMAMEDYCAPEILKEVARTSAFRARLKKVGFLPPSPDEPNPFNQLRPTRSREVLKKFGVEIPKPPPPPPPRTLWVGVRHPYAREIRVDRTQLFERVWSEPVQKLAGEWGLSGPGLKKVCHRLQVPVPPRGYWAKLKAGYRAPRPRLPTLAGDVVPEIIFRAP